jgi:hypothetical protein
MIEGLPLLRLNVLKHRGALALYALLEQIQRFNSRVHTRMLEPEVRISE